MLSLGVAVAVLAALMVTSRDFGLVWDEAFTIRRERVLDEWVNLLVDPPFPGAREQAFRPPMLDRHWPFSRKEPDGHPPFYAILGLAAWKISHRGLPPLLAYRLGPMLLMSLTCGVICRHLSRRCGRVAGVLGSLLLVLLPRNFAHAHYAHYDMPMTCLWLLAQVAFVASLESRRWIVPFGICLGLACGTKFTGVFAVAAPVGWVLLVEVLPLLSSPQEKVRLKPGLRALLGGLPVAVLTLYAIQPAWWLAPLDGPWRFLASNLSRDQTKPLPTLYFGRIFLFSLPSHNTVVYTLFTTPTTALILAACGIAGCVSRRKSSPSSLIWPLSWGVLMVVRALPNAPGHDSIRLILPSVASLAVLAGMGGEFVVRTWFNLRQETGARARRWPAACLVMTLTFGECLLGIGRMYPYTDSYCNELFGGLKSAERNGFEITYYWETAGPEFLRWVRDEARRRPVALCMALPLDCRALLREWGQIPPEVRFCTPDDPSGFDYVHQRRRGFYYTNRVDWWLDRHGTPRFVIRRAGVDLLRAYPHEQWLEATRHARDQPLPPLELP